MKALESLLNNTYFVPLVPKVSLGTQSEKLRFEKKQI